MYPCASDVAPDRAEALHGASRLCRNISRHAQAFGISARGIGLDLPAEGLFVKPWIYGYGLHDEYAVYAYWAGHYRECLDASLKMLACKTMPQSMH